MENAAWLMRFPPGAAGSEIHTGCPGTISGRDVAVPLASGEVENTCKLNGNPLRATMTASSDQFLVTWPRIPDVAAAGGSTRTPAEKLWRTSKLDEA